MEVHGPSSARRPMLARREAGQGGFIIEGHARQPQGSRRAAPRQCAGAVRGIRSRHRPPRRRRHAARPGTPLCRARADPAQLLEPDQEPFTPDRRTPGATVRTPLPQAARLDGCAARRQRGRRAGRRGRAARRVRPARRRRALHRRPRAHLLPPPPAARTHAPAGPAGRGADAGRSRAGIASRPTGHAGEAALAAGRGRPCAVAADAKWRRAAQAPQVSLRSPPRSQGVVDGYRGLCIDNDMFIICASLQGGQSGTLQPINPSPERHVLPANPQQCVCIPPCGGRSRDACCVGGRHVEPRPEPWCSARGAGELMPQA
ncbi:hypothetical protein RA210_U50020 [Rubrivivax sp. A210]|nr:hypothetical protein RA210_U50020 [Rubrivivax sp. A210]